LSKQEVEIIARFASPAIRDGAQALAVEFGRSPPAREKKIKFNLERGEIEQKLAPRRYSPPWLES